VVFPSSYRRMVGYFVREATLDSLHISDSWSSCLSLLHKITSFKELANGSWSCHWHVTWLLQRYWISMECLHCYRWQLHCNVPISNQNLATV
jgi:hypothetical protein